MNNSMASIIIATIVQNNTALTPTAGEKVFVELDKTLKDSNVIKTVLDFKGITAMTTAFLNASIGQLYAHYNSDFLNARLQIINLSSDDLVLLRRVIVRAKEYFSDKGNLDAL